MVWLTIMVLTGVAFGAAFALSMIYLGWLHLVAVRLSPPGHVRVGKDEDTKTYADLKLGGYKIEADWRSDAVAHIDKK